MEEFIESKQHFCGQTITEDMKLTSDIVCYGSTGITLSEGASLDSEGYTIRAVNPTSGANGINIKNKYDLNSSDQPLPSVNRIIKPII